MKALLSLVLLVATSLPQHPCDSSPIVSRVDSGGDGKLLREVKDGERSRQSGAITLDPVSIISLLALGAFLINNILQLLKTNQLMNHSGRSLDVTDLSLPLELSDIDTNGGIDFSRDPGLEDMKFNMGNLLGNVGSLYFVTPKKRNACLKRVLLCSRDELSSGIWNKFRTSQFKSWDFLLSIVTKMVSARMRGTSNRSCKNLDEICSDWILKEAKVTTRNKLSSLLSSYAVQRLIS